MMASSVRPDSADIVEIFALLVGRAGRQMGLASSSLKPMMLVSGVRSS